MEADTFRGRGGGLLRRGKIIRIFKETFSVKEICFNFEPKSKCNDDCGLSTNKRVKVSIHLLLEM